MSTQTINADMVGREFDVIEGSWETKDALLYAVGVGCKPTDELDFVFEGKGPKVLPTFGVIPGFAVMGTSIGSIPGVNPAMILHGEQSITQHREIPPSAKVRSRG